MAKEGIPEKYIRTEDFFKDAKPNTTAEEVRKQQELHYLLKHYSPDYVEKPLDIQDRR